MAISGIILFYCFGQFSVMGALLVAIIFGMVLNTELEAKAELLKWLLINSEPFPVIL
jgi:hypothetical protein